MKIKFGTNRIVFITKKYAYKIPISTRGIAANYLEFINSYNNDLVAKTELHWYGLRQEKLTNIIIYPYKVKESEISIEHKELYRIMLHNRLQVGKDVNGNWKIFDYEDVKFYINNKEAHMKNSNKEGEQVC